jgi:hypothetical protein
VNEEERVEIISEIQREFHSLDKDNYDDDANLARQRGYDFEKLVRRLFKSWGMLRRGPYHTGDNRSEQIDGVVQFNERFALLEVKWEKANLAASELFSFLGKVEGKFVGTIGIFVSRKELTKNFLTALRAGRRQCIIVIHGEDVEHMFDPTFDFPDYLSSHFMHICMDNTCHLSASKYVAKLKKEAAKKTPPPASDAVNDRILEVLNDKVSENVVDEFAQALQPQERVTAIERIVTNYADVAASQEKDGAWKTKNLTEFLKELVARLPANLTAADTTFFLENLSKDFKSTHYGPLTEYFAPRYQYIDGTERAIIEKRLRKQWDKVIDEWVLENYMSLPTDKLWPYLSEATKNAIIPHFVGFILSHRRANHEQYRLARKVLKEPASVSAAGEALKVNAENSAKSWFEGEEVDEEYTRKGKSWIKRSLNEMKQYVPDFDGIIDQAVDEAAAKAQATQPEE